MMRIVAMVLGLVAAAWGQELPSAGTVVVNKSGGGWGESHGWIISALTGGEDRAAVLHIPPRRAAGRADGHADLAEGSIRPAARFGEMPERIGAWGDDLWIAFPKRGAGRTVLHLRVERGPLDSPWVTAGAGGRLPSLAALPGDGELFGFVGTSAGPAALMYEGSGYALLVYRGSGWERESLPPSVSPAAPTTRVDLVAAPGLCLVRWTETDCTEWRREMSGGEWESRRLSLRTESGRIATEPDRPPFMIGGELVYAARTGGLMEVWNPTPGGCRLVANVGGIAGKLGVAPLDQTGAIVALCEEAGPPVTSLPSRDRSTERPVQTSSRIVELSVHTGSVLYDGVPRVRGPLSSVELKLLALILVGVMGVVLVVILQPGKNGSVVSLPEGVVLAEPGRRIAAGAVDLLVAVLIAMGLRRMAMSELSAPASLLADPRAVEMILTVIGAGLVHCTVGEWLTGRSIGKTVTGCATARIVMLKRGGDGQLMPMAVKPGLWRAAVRNLVRWTLAPLAIAGLNGPDHRHRGDLAAGTVVVRAADGPATE